MSEPMGKLINRIPSLPLLISSLPDLALRMHVESLDKPCDSTSVLKTLPGVLDIKRLDSAVVQKQDKKTNKQSKKYQRNNAIKVKQLLSSLPFLTWWTTCLVFGMYCVNDQL